MIISKNATDLCLILQEEATSPWLRNNKLGPNTIDDAGVLLDFAMWKKSVISYLPSHDHAGLFTGYVINVNVIMLSCFFFYFFYF